VFVLAVDLDETLIAADTLIEGAAVLVKRHPSYIIRLLRWLAAGKHRFKARIAGAVTLDVARLPYRAEVLEYLRAARSQGRRIVLATAANGRVANQVAAHLGLFDEVIASDDAVNLAGERKRQRLVALYGERGFDYVGSGRADVPVWRSARLAVLVGHDAALSRRASATLAVATSFGPISTRTGTPRISQSLNLKPGVSSRSSNLTRRPDGMKGRSATTAGSCANCKG
jgi:phosphoserine phosphatase